MSRRMLLLGLNQTILFALSMVVIAGLIGGGGLGAVVNNGLSSNPALAILAGIVIVVMAMALDRITEAIANRTDPTKRHLDAVGEAATAHRVARRRCGDRRHGDRREGDRRQRRVPGERGHPAARGHGAGVAARADPEGARLHRGPDDVGLPDHRARRATSSSRRLLLPLQAFLMEAPWFTTLGGLDADRLRRLGPAAGDHDVLHARPDRLHGRLGARDGHALAGARGDAHRRRPRLRARRLGVREPDRLGSHAPDQRRAADPAAARLHHPVHLPDARLDRARDRGRRCSTPSPSSSGSWSEA